MAKTILITGGAGFIGSNFIRYILNESEAVVVNLDALTYAGNLENLADIEQNPRYKFVHGRIENRELVLHVCKQFNVEGIINFAAESHVDRSIIDAQPFVDTNITGTLVLMNVARELGLEKFVQVSTDEVYGSLGEQGEFTEDSQIAPNSPYSAAKSAADGFVRSFVHTYNFPAVITRCSNNYGAFQFPEKLIPLMILNALEGKQLPVYGDGKNIRDWIDVRDHSSAVWLAYNNGKNGEVYNIGAESERQNIEVVRAILALTGKREELITYVKDRPGHDRRYAIDSTKIRQELGWKPTVNFEDGLEQTVQWYRDNAEWCARVRSGEYMKYYQKQYEFR
ncbi:MAG: dTDP-glucose 4,6-dehydratase [Bacteroidetes bacterium]|nr:dTDP-glucose 4,6-dehydratase [Bacteroidota bacterium]